MSVNNSIWSCKLRLLGLCLRIDASFVTAAVSLSFELPPTESFRSFSAPEAFRPVGGPDDMGPGLGATDDEAVEADGGLELRSRFTGDLVRVEGRAEEPLEDLPVDEGTRSIFNRNEKPIMLRFIKPIYGCHHPFMN